MLYFGHEKTKILDIGIRSWHKKELPITRDMPKPISAKFIPKINSSIRIEAEELHKEIDTAVIIDARSPQEFMTGRILNAVFFPFTEGVGEGGSLFKEKNDSRESLASNKYLKIKNWYATVHLVTGLQMFLLNYKWLDMIT